MTSPRASAGREEAVHGLRAKSPSLSSRRDRSPLALSTERIAARLRQPVAAGDGAQGRLTDRARVQTPGAGRRSRRWIRAACPRPGSPLSPLAMSTGPQLRRPASGGETRSPPAGPGRGRRSAAGPRPTAWPQSASGRSRMRTSIVHLLSPSSRVVLIAVGVRDVQRVRGLDREPERADWGRLLPVFGTGGPSPSAASSAVAGMAHSVASSSVSARTSRRRPPSSRAAGRDWITTLHEIVLRPESRALAKSAPDQSSSACPSSCGLAPNSTVNEMTYHETCALPPVGGPFRAPAGPELGGERLREVAGRRVVGDADRDFHTRPRSWNGCQEIRKSAEAVNHARRLPSWNRTCSPPPPITHERREGEVRVALDGHEVVHRPRQRETRLLRVLGRRLERRVVAAEREHEVARVVAVEPQVESEAACEPARGRDHERVRAEHGRQAEEALLRFEDRLELELKVRERPPPPPPAAAFWTARSARTASPARTPRSAAPAT